MDDCSGFAFDLTDLLDLIELNASDEAMVRRLCRQRFALAQAHGFEVMVGHPISGAVN
jgi:hypothetical protein